MEREERIRAERHELELQLAHHQSERDILSVKTQKSPGNPKLEQQFQHHKDEVAKLKESISTVAEHYEAARSKYNKYYEVSRILIDRSGESFRNLHKNREDLHKARDASMYKMDADFKKKKSAELARREKLVQKEREIQRTMPSEGDVVEGVPTATADVNTTTEPDVSNELSIDGRVMSSTSIPAGSISEAVTLPSVTTAVGSVAKAIQKRDIRFAVAGALAGADELCNKVLNKGLA